MTDEKNVPNNKTVVAAYGFDALGFQATRSPLEISPDLILKRIDFESSESLEKADAVIIPQGIFETFKRQPNFAYEFFDVYSRKDLLLERERQVFNLFRENKWVCFLVGEIIDQVPYGFQTKPANDTDLCKTVLNKLRVERKRAGGLSILEAKYDAFRPYIREYGVAKTIFEPAKLTEVLVKSSSFIVGIEAYERLFFLPFHTTKRDSSTFIAIIQTVTNAIGEYRKKRTVLSPPWLEEFQFKCEEGLRNEIALHLDKMVSLQNTHQTWKAYKNILNTSGEILRKRIIDTLEKFFGLKVDPTDDGLEDAKILDEGSKPLCFIESKGTNKGIKREHINQVDSHRERNELSANTPGLLLINNEMGIEGIEARLETKVPEEQVKHACTLNVLIIRTIDLLFYMKHFEEKSLEDRKKEFLQILNAGGGWLKASPESFELVK